MVNDGVPAAESAAATSEYGGSGLDSLSARLASIGGRLTASVGSDGCFHLVARTGPTATSPIPEHKRPRITARRHSPRA